MSILIHKKFHNNSDFHTVDDNFIKVNVTINQKLITVHGVYAISDNEPNACKDEFYGKLNDEILKVWNTI